MSSAPRTRFRRQVRNFALIWAGITFILGATTFIAIYAGYGSLTASNDSLRNIAIPTGTQPVQQAAVVPTSMATSAQPSNSLVRIIGLRPPVLLDRA